jgi:hypothetical protein
MKITSRQLRQIIREELLREGTGKHTALQFGQPDLRTFEESLEITFPYTLLGEDGDETLNYGSLEDAKADPMAVLEHFAENNLHLAYRIDNDLEDDDEAIRIVKSALMNSPGFDMDQFASDLAAAEPNRFDAEF